MALNQAKAGLIFKSIVQKPTSGDEERQTSDLQDGMERFVMLYLTRFLDKIQLTPGFRLEVLNCRRFISTIS